MGIVKSVMYTIIITIFPGAEIRDKMVRGQYITLYCPIPYRPCCHCCKPDLVFITINVVLSTSCGASFSDISHWTLTSIGQLFLWLIWRIKDRATLSAVSTEHALFERNRSTFEYSEFIDELHPKEILDEQLLSLSKSRSSQSSVVDMLDVVEQYEDVNELAV